MVFSICPPDRLDRLRYFIPPAPFEIFFNALKLTSTFLCFTAVVVKTATFCQITSHPQMICQITYYP